MNEFYKINGDYAEIILQKGIYPLVSVQKALSNYLDDTVIKLEDNYNEIKIKLKIIKEINIEFLVEQILNECLRETLRYNISKETKNLRELIVGRALYSTCINLDDNELNTNLNDNFEKIEDSDFNVNDIAVNWFDQNNEDENK